MPVRESWTEISELTRDVEQFRRFNRTYTKFVGSLNETLLESDFSLAEARVLYEVATQPGCRASEIAQTLGMDAGYLSRVLRKFERKTLLRRKPSQDDARSAELSLTPKGKSNFVALNGRSNEQARSFLLRLPPAQRSQVMISMQNIETALTGTDCKSRIFVLRPPRTGDMGWVIYRESVGYAEQFGWDQKFEALVIKIVSEFLTDVDRSRERCWIAEMDGQNVGHIFLVKHPEERQTARLRLLFVEPAARGHGVGEALVTECVRFARTAGYKRIVLWTQSILKQAIRLYQRAGFRLIKEEHHNSFGHNLTGQEWELTWEAGESGADLN